MSSTSRSSSYRTPGSIFTSSVETDANSIHNNLTDVPEEEGQDVAPPIPSSPYLSVTPSVSTPTFNGPAKQLRKPSSGRSLSRASSEQLASVPSIVKRSASTSAAAQQPGASSTARTPRSTSSSNLMRPKPPIRANPRLPHDKEAEPAPSTVLHWSRAPVWGTLPTRTMRAHTVTLVDTTAWLFGGCDDKESSKDVYCFDTETMQWTRPETVGEQPPPCRAHTTTLYDKKLLVFGGGLSSTYYDTVYVFDTQARRWSRPKVAPGPHPAARRAHSAVYYKGKVWIFGGGTGLTALNDIWTLDVSNGAGTTQHPMKWEMVETQGKMPGPRGYHTANLVDNIMLIMGGSDGKESFTDMWCLNLDTLLWKNVTQHPPLYKRLAHTSTQVGTFLFIVGGHNASEYVSELLCYDLVSLQYEPRKVLGKPPPNRGYHATILADYRLFVFGGYNGQTAFDDVYILELAASAYLPQVTSFNMDLSLL